MRSRSGEKARSDRPRFVTYCAFAAAFGLIIFLSHVPCLQLPYFWDEMGQFIPAALDIFHDNSWIPHSTTPNVHPPGVMAWLALVWKIAGYSIEATRVAMLLVATATALAVFLLAIQLCRRLPGAPAFSAAALLLASPLFYAQAMLAQLDMPATLFTALSLLFFCRTGSARRHWLASRLCSRRRPVRCFPSSSESGCFASGACARRSGLPPHSQCSQDGSCCCNWERATALGNREFARYNLFFPLHPARLSVSLFRRFYYVFVDNFHWIGTVAIVMAWKRNSLFRERAWAVTATVLFGHLLLVSVLGGATLERYLLPVIPLFYIAVGAAWSAMVKSWRTVSQYAMVAGLLFGLFWNPPWPFPFENNLAVVDFIKLHREAAEFVEATYRNETIVSAWPFPDALRRPEFGYVTHSLKTEGIEDFHFDTVAALKKKGVKVLVVYSSTWEPEFSVLQLPIIKRFLAKYYFYDRQITSEEIREQLGLISVAHYSRRGQWIEVYSDER